MLKDYIEFKSKATAIVEELKETVATATNNEMKLYVSYHYVFHDTTSEPFYESTSKAIQLCYEKGYPTREILFCVFVEDLNELERLNILDKMIKKLKEDEVILGAYSMDKRTHLTELFHNLTTALDGYLTKISGASTAPLNKGEEE